ncbi:MAG TPA: RNA polymerase subunit sigma-70 [Solirubrobacteraceae bacterium]|nr:RNA polymerase subunit sigma-70 [Solirubrobacteraceae bacterium]
MTADLDTSFDHHRRELHVHCYRMLGSFDEAEDAVQEVFLRAWRGRDSLTGGDNVRAWLYKIATNVCLDALRARSRRAPALQSFADVPWLQPYPDRLLDEIAPPEDEPDAVVVARETIALAYVAVIQLLPPRQRAVLILRDVLEWSAKETADMLGISVAAANSALQRARATLEDQPMPSTTGALSEAERDLLERYVDAHQRADVQASLALTREDIRVTMPPHPVVYDGVEQVRPLIAEGLPGAGDWRVLATSANRMPAAACYLREPGGTEFRAFKIDVLRVVDGKVAEITTFDASLFDRFGLPESV